MNKPLHFKSRKDHFFRLVILGTIALLMVTSVSFWMESNSPLFTAINTLICGGISLFLLWMFYGTSYSIKSDTLRYASGPIKGSINISDITKLELNQTKYVGLKIATARKGIIIHYNKYDELYISPANNEEFAAALKAINPAIILQ